MPAPTCPNPPGGHKVKLPLIQKRALLECFEERDITLRNFA
jgi:hypothetical protein